MLLERVFNYVLSMQSLIFLLLGGIFPSVERFFSEICGDAAAIQALKGEGFACFIFLESTSLRYFIFKLWHHWENMYEPF